MATCLAYAYRGLRPADVAEWLRARKAEFEAQVGPASDRPAYTLFSSLVSTARAAASQPAAAAARRLEPLDILNPADAAQVRLAHEALGHDPLAIEQWLDAALSRTSEAEAAQLTASGHDLGSDAIFPQVGRHR